MHKLTLRFTQKGIENLSPVLLYVKNRNGSHFCKNKTQPIDFSISCALTTSLPVCYNFRLKYTGGEAGLFKPYHKDRLYLELKNNRTQKNTNPGAREQTNGSNWMQWRTQKNTNPGTREQTNGSNWLHWWRVVDGRRTLQPIEIPLLIKIHRKRSMDWLIALDEPIFNKPTKTYKPTDSTPYYDYVI